MRNLYARLIAVTMFMSVMAITSYSQGGLSGTVIDNEKEPLIGATVIARGASGSSAGTVTDIDGSFAIGNLADGSYKVVVTYTGYETSEEEVTVSGSNVEMGNVTMNFGSIGLAEVNVIASVAIDRRTPVAVSTIKGDQIEALLGNQEYPEILRNTPSIYVTKSGGGFGDSRINVRGFDQRNTAVLINGIPVNDMENGWVYWSNWAGLSDVTSTLQVQRGLGAAKIVVPSVGGSINIVTNAADFKKGGKAGVSIGNDGYQKYEVMLASGLSEKGFAATAQFTHTRGDGYVDGTQFRAYSYFLSLSKTFNDKHTLALTAIGAPQWHNQRTFSTFDKLFLQTYKDKGIRYNPNWGTLDGKEFTWRKNFYHKPKVFLNHYWNISDKTDLKTSAYVSMGRGGGTGPRGRLRTPGSVYDSYGGDDTGIYNSDGQVRFDDIAAYNSGQSVSDWGDVKEQYNGQNVVSSDGKIDGNAVGSGFIRRASMNSHNWYGVLSTLTSKLNENLTLIGGVDGRYYKGIHYRRLENLLGADGYLARSDDNNPANLITETSAADFGNFSDDSYKNGNNVLAYRNDGLVSWMGLFGQLEYAKDNLSAFVSVAGSNQGFKRVDYFNYLDSDPQQETDWENFLGLTTKAGFNYNISDRSNIFVNAGYLSKQPLFDNVYINFVNQLSDVVENQDIYSFEAGYGFRSRNFKANLNIYNTTWDNRQFDESFEALTVSGDEVDVLATYFGVKERHSGVELDFSYRPITALTFTGMLSVGNWEYAGKFQGNVANLDSEEALQDFPDNKISIFADGIKVGDAAQTTFSLGATLEPVYGLKVYGNYYYADNLYAQFNILEDQFKKAGGQVVKIPSYSLVDAGVSYTFDFNKTSMTIRVNVNNVLDETYIAEMDTNISDDKGTPEDEFYTKNQGFYGFGRTWNAGVKLSF
jgi:carboxypeptidase-like protein/TonB-dependent receptor-like protein